VNSILGRLKKKKLVEPKDIQYLEGFINHNLKVNYGLSKQFIRWWNMYYKPQTGLTMEKAGDNTIKLVFEKEKAA